RLLVVHNGVAPGFSPRPDPEADQALAEMLRSEAPALLHVGSTIPRKRIELLLASFALVRQVRDDLLLVRIGGPFTRSQQAMVDAMGLDQHIRVLPFLDRRLLAAAYRRSTLVLLPSEREGFGLPLVEAMACGTPVLASDLPVFREVGAAAAAYCPGDDPEEWRDRTLELLAERDGAPDLWERRRRAGMERASAFSWASAAEQLSDLYHSVMESAGARK
ncbi:MAG TPA: glycosyltransferase, partial [Vicinamibacterales bacterium]